ASTNDLTSQYTGSLTLTSLTVAYTGAANQKVDANTFDNVTVNSGHTLTLVNDITINGNLLLTSGTLAAGQNNITLNGSFTNNSGTGAFSAGTGILTLGGSSATTISGT